MTNRLLLALLIAVAAPLAACSHSMPIQRQKYATQRMEKVFEGEFPAVWKAVEAALRNYTITERDPAEADEVALRRLTRRSLQTGWIYSQSRDKYVEYRVNDVPYRKPLQVRTRYRLVAQRSLGGVTISLAPEEEIENLRPDGTQSGYSGVDQVDTSRAAELLEKIHLKFLSGEP